LVSGQAQILLKDDFSSYRNGSDGSPLWHPAKGNWHIENGAYIEEAADYDCASMLGLYLDESFEFQATFELLDGEAGAGFVFSSRDSDATRFAQLARFDGPGVFIAGYYQGEFNGMASAKVEPFDSKISH